MRYGAELGGALLLVILVLVVIVDDDLECLYRLLRTLSSPILVPQALPQHFPLKHARFTLELENHGQHALQDAQATQGLPGSTALCAVAAFDVSRREIDRIRGPGVMSYDAKEDRDIVGRSCQGLMKFCGLEVRGAWKAECLENERPDENGILFVQP
jgi:hypothetical protein